MTTTTDESDSTETTSNPWADALAKHADANALVDPSEATHDDYHILHEQRWNRPIGTDDDLGALPNPAHECGCDNPFCSASAEASDISGTCDEPAVPSINFATRQFKRLLQWGHGRTEGLGLNRVKAQYARIHYGDRELRDEYDDATTILLTFRLSPTTGDGNLRSPLVLRDQLAGTWDKVQRDLFDSRYGVLADYDTEYVRVTSGTPEWATPHLHVLVYADDSDDEIRATDFQSTVAKHTEEYAHARRSHHPIDDDGDDGTVTVFQDPPLADESEREYAVEQIRETDARRVKCATQAAKYVATQIPRYLVADAIENGDRLDQWKWATAAWAWCSSKDSVTFSRGFPSDE